VRGLSSVADSGSAVLVSQEPMVVVSLGSVASVWKQGTVEGHEASGCSVCRYFKENMQVCINH
jgi:hypothetical protein